jgi:hypothetical protein
MMSCWLTMSDIQEVFAAEIAAVGGTVSEVFNDGNRLFARSILPGVEKLRRGDDVKGGVALRATEDDIWVHPYLFRLLCSNGLIETRALQTRHIQRAEFLGKKKGTEILTARLCKAVQACCARETFLIVTEGIRATKGYQRDLSTLLWRLSEQLVSEFGKFIADKVVVRYAQEKNPSLFDLVNAVTSVARDSADPEVRWHLEVLGGMLCSDRMFESWLDSEIIRLADDHYRSEEAASTLKEQLPRAAQRLSSAARS